MLLFSRYSTIVSKWHLNGLHLGWLHCGEHRHQHPNRLPFNAITLAWKSGSVNLFLKYGMNLSHTSSRVPSLPIIKGFPNGDPRPQLTSALVCRKFTMTVGFNCSDIYPTTGISLTLDLRTSFLRIARSLFIGLRFQVYPVRVSPAYGPVQRPLER